MFITDLGGLVSFCFGIIGKIVLFFKSYELPVHLANKLFTFERY